MKKLQETLESRINQLDAETRMEIAAMDGGGSVYPFNKFAHILTVLCARDILTEQEYLEIQKDYQDRNRYLSLFDIAPRTFGEVWGETHIQQICSSLHVPTSAEDPVFDHEYDLIYNGIRVEVKATRATYKKGGGTLSSRAMSLQEVIDLNYKMHFQQLKPSCCDVFIWICVCRDQIIYAVLSSHECGTLKGFGSQHRNENTGNANAEVYEGQVFIAYRELEKFIVAESHLLWAVNAKST